MPTLLCFGLGYSARHYLAEFGDRFDRVIGTVRDGGRAAALTRDGLAGRPIEMLAFPPSGAGDGVGDDVPGAIAEADAVLVSAPPDAGGDPVLARHAAALAQASTIRSFVYLSTVGVYGDHGGAWVDEASEARAVSPRTRLRLTAEAAWRSLGAATRRPVAVLRLAGIYGPGRNALVNLVERSARRIVKPGQVFNRIHVADIARAIDAAFAHGADGTFNVTDDEPAPPQEVIAYAAGLIGIPPPPEIPFAEAVDSMTPMARSFYSENRRVGNARLKRELGVALRHPTYRAGIEALFRAGDHRRPAT
jgi:nucleoside-diphosphate-sugar epimerase